jgi:P27 family predicted phage terminase small subunit
MLTVADAPILEATCLAYQDFREANDDLRRVGRYHAVATKSGGVMLRSHPALAVRAESWRRYVMGLTHFGLSPSTRTKVHAEPAQGSLFDDGDAFERWASLRKDGSR